MKKTYIYIIYIYIHWLLCVCVLRFGRYFEDEAKTSGHDLSMLMTLKLGNIDKKPGWDKRKKKLINEYSKVRIDQMQAQRTASRSPIPIPLSLSLSLSSLWECGCDDENDVDETY